MASGRSRSTAMIRRYTMITLSRVQCRLSANLHILRHLTSAAKNLWLADKCDFSGVFCFDFI